MTKFTNGQRVVLARPSTGYETLTGNVATIERVIDKAGSPTTHFIRMDDYTEHGRLFFCAESELDLVEVNQGGGGPAAGFVTITVGGGGGGSSGKPPLSEAEKRKGQPVTTGVLHYFPDAIKALAEVSKIGNDQHNPGQPLHWARGKSMDHLNCAGRHLIDHAANKFDTDGGRHLAKLAWRALAQLQLDIEAERETK